MTDKRSINGQIFSLSWPAIITNITTPLMGLIDVAIVGHLGDASYIAAIALGSTLFNMLYWVLNFLRMGTSGLTAQAYGSGDGAEMMLTLKRSLAIAGVLSALVLGLAPLLGDTGLAILGAVADTRGAAHDYFMIAVLGAPAVLGGYALSGWFIGMQTSRPILIVALVTNLANIALSFTFVYGFDLSIAGVAMGTAISQWIGLAVSTWIARRLARTVNHRGGGRIFARAPIKKFFAVNRDIFLRTLCLVTVTTWFTHVGAVEGTSILAANTLLNQLFMIFSFFTDGFAFAGEAMAGRFAGARDMASLKTTVRMLFCWSGAIAVVFTVVYGLFGGAIIGLLTDSEETLAVARDYLMWAAAIPLCGFGAFTWDGIFIGLTRTRQMLISMAMAMVVFFIFLQVPIPDNHCLWAAFLAYLLARSVAQTILWRRVKNDFAE